MLDDLILGPTYDYMINREGIITNQYATVNIVVVYGEETTVTIYMQTSDGKLRNIVVRAWNHDYKTPIGKECATILQETDEKKAFGLMQRRHPLILGIKGVSSWEDILLMEKGEFTTASLYDLTKFGGYDFENAKCQLQALAMRKTIISAKNAYMAEDRKPVSADNLQVGYKIIAMPVQTQSTILAIRQSA